MFNVHLSTFLHGTTVSNTTMEVKKVYDGRSIWSTMEVKKVYDKSSKCYEGSLKCYDGRSKCYDRTVE